MNTEEYLEHIGVLGMHWGKRKSKGPNSTKGKESGSEDHNKKIILKKKKIHEMSNVELRALNERLQLERQYKDLSKSDKSTAAKTVKDLLANAGKETAKNFVSKAMAKGVSKGIDTLIKKKKLRDYYVVI